MLSQCIRERTEVSSNVTRITVCPHVKIKVEPLPHTIFFKKSAQMNHKFKWRAKTIKLFKENTQYIL